MDLIDISLKLAQNRLKSNLSQVELAQKMSTTQSVISRAESGSVTPSLEFMQRWARATGISLQIILEAKNPKPLSRAAKRALVISVLGRGRFNPWDRNLSQVEKDLLIKAGHTREYFEKRRRPPEVLISRLKKRIVRPDKSI